jgi:hypothetical protein
MPARKSPADWKPRTIALLRKAAEVGSIRAAAHAVGEKREPLIDDAQHAAERVELEMIHAEPGTCDPRRYLKACAEAARRMEAA